MVSGQEGMAQARIFGRINSSGYLGMDGNSHAHHILRSVNIELMIEKLVGHLDALSSTQIKWTVRDSRRSI